jgi:hypothetical protein
MLERQKRAACTARRSLTSYRPIKSCTTSRGLTGFARQHRPVGLLSPVERLLGDPDLATDVTDWYAARYLLQHRRDLLDGKPLLLLGTTSQANWPDCAAELALQMH